MAVTRTPNFKTLPLNVVGSSIFGRYPKIDAEHTLNMYIADNFLVNYTGYKIGLDADLFGGATTGRAIYVSVKLNKIILVYNDRVYLLTVDYNETQNKILSYTLSLIGNLLTFSGEVFIAENNKPQILLSDGSYLYVYDPSLTQLTTDFTVNDTTGVFTYTTGRPLVTGEPITFDGASLPPPLSPASVYYVSADTSDFVGSSTLQFHISSNITDAYLGINSVALTGAGTAPYTFATQGTFQRPPLSFKPGHVSFHDTFGLCAASFDQYYSPAANNTWRISMQDNFLVWPDDATTIGLLETKPDNTKAIFRFPSGGNMIFVLGENVTEAWFAVGSQLFPYQRNNQYNIDYGCISPGSVAQLNNLAVWVAQNEKSGPVIMYSEGSLPQTISTDGISYLLSNLQFPSDCSAYIFRQYGHTIYHVNFHADNLSFFYDFQEKKFYEASDQNHNYYHISSIGFYSNQYFGISKDTGDFYIVDSRVTYYEQVDKADIRQIYEIPRIRTTSNIRLPSQDYFIVNDVGFTIESGETDYHVQTLQYSGNLSYDLVTEDDDELITEDGDDLITNQLDPSADTVNYIQRSPTVALSLSRNGGATFGSYYEKTLPAIGIRKNRVLWWQGGICNDLVCKIEFRGFGRIAATNGEVNIR